MREDYLWDKTGENAEIESLENTLQAFRYQETAPPALPAKVIPFKKEPARKIYRFAMAAAACLVFGLFALGALIQFSGNKTETGNNLAGINKSQSETPIAESIAEETEVLPAETLDILPVKKAENPKQTSAQKIVKIRNNVPINDRQKETKAKAVKNVKPEVQLTKEEQYAYDRLMLALSITSSKLKMVKDKVEGLEEQAAVIENGK